MKRIGIIILFIITGLATQAQVEIPQVSTDSAQRGVVQVDSAARRDSLNRLRELRRIQQERQRFLADSTAIVHIQAQDLMPPPGLTFQRLKQQLWNDELLPFSQPPLQVNEKEFIRENRDVYFYILIVMLFFYGMIKLFFPKYVHWLFSHFLRPNMRQQQMRDHLLQSPLASLMLNFLFILAGGLFMLFLAGYYDLQLNEPEWKLWLLYSGCLLALSIGQYILLKTIGWLFNISTTIDTYIFVIFLVNKIVGIILLPVIVLMAFPLSALLPVLVTITYMALALLLVYRFLISYKSIGNEIKVSRFHFFLYLCAFEIAPLLIIGKVLLDYVESSY